MVSKNYEALYTTQGHSRNDLEPADLRSLSSPLPYSAKYTEIDKHMPGSTVHPSCQAIISYLPSLIFFALSILESSFTLTH